jgi:hypothetical protein
VRALCLTLWGLCGLCGGTERRRGQPSTLFTQQQQDGDSSSRARSYGGLCPIL